MDRDEIGSQMVAINQQVMAAARAFGRPPMRSSGAPLMMLRRAAEQFADYWGGAASWQNMSAERRNTFVEALKPNYFEWDAVMDETTHVEEWARRLPRSTLLVSDPNTVLPIREITEILRRSCPHVEVQGNCGRRSHGAAYSS
jgi:hypothetical protein